MAPLLVLALAAGWIGGLFVAARQTTSSSQEIKLERGKVYRIRFELPPNVRVENAGVPNFFRGIGFALTGGLEQLPSLPSLSAPQNFNAFGVWSEADGANPMPLIRSYTVNGNQLVILNIGPV